MIEDELFIDPQSPVLITGYQVRDPEKNQIYFSLGKELGPEMCENSDAIEGIDPTLGIKYIFPKEFLNCKVISSQLVFKNLSDQPLTNVIIKETHSLGTKQLQQFEFKLEFVPPNTVNTWEHQYDPQFKMNKQFVDAAIKGPWNVSTQLFVGDKQYMHTKAMLTFK